MTPSVQEALIALSRALADRGVTETALECDARFFEEVVRSSFVQWHGFDGGLGYVPPVELMADLTLNGPCRITLRRRP